MAKKKAAGKSPGKSTVKSAKSAAKAYPPARGKKVSVKRIVAEIDRTLAKLQPAKAAAQAKGGADPQSHAIERAIQLSRDKYCSVWHSLRDDIQLDTTFEVDAET